MNFFSYDRLKITSKPVALNVHQIAFLLQCDSLLFLQPEDMYYLPQV